MLSSQDIVCKKCHTPKQRSEFTNRLGKLYKKLWCKPCVREYDRASYASNPAPKKAIARKWASDNRVRHSELTLAWAKANPDKHRKACNTWEANHPDRARLKNYIRRERTSGENGVITETEWETLKSTYGYRCLCCGKHNSESPLTLDHVIPLHFGGRNLILNSQPLCKPCNSRKGTKSTDYRVDKQLGQELRAA